MKTRTRTMTRLLAASLLTGAIGVAMANDPQTKEEGGSDKMLERESSQPIDDTWITTKVKADLLATDDVGGLQLNVETVEGVVSLSGEVDSQAEADRAVAVAKGIEGVTRVDASAITVRAAADGGMR